MSTVSLKTAAGKDAGSVELDTDVFGIQPNVPVMHQVVTAQLAARRSGTQSTKTDRKSTRLNSSHVKRYRKPSSA